jgi:hypothetical protein
VNLGKTKVMWGGEVQQSESSAKYPCTVCGKGVGRNSILCGKCNKWTHKRCSGIKGSIMKVRNFICVRCENGSREDRLSLVLEEGLEVERVRKFCYLGDMVEEYEWMLQ